MYDITFAPVTVDEIWSESVQVLDDATDAAEDISGWAIVLTVERNGVQEFSVSSTAGTITKPTTGTFSWSIAQATMGGLCIGEHEVGCTFDDGSGPVQLFIGTLPVIDGYMT